VRHERFEKFEKRPRARIVYLCGRSTTATRHRRAKKHGAGAEQYNIVGKPTATAGRRRVETVTVGRQVETHLLPRVPGALDVS
jgi:hypothetical protein